VKLSEELAARARAQLDVDEPSVEALQTLLLLVTAFTASGRGKKAYMLLSKCKSSSEVGFGPAAEPRVHPSPFCLSRFFLSFLLPDQMDLKIYDGD
jgi:hypothetical protein